MIKMRHVDEMKFTKDNEKYDYDYYLFDVPTLFSTKEYNIAVDFIEESITGDYVAHGGWHDLEMDECIEVMEMFLIDNKPNRDFTHILNKLKK